MTVPADKKHLIAEFAAFKEQMRREQAPERPVTPPEGRAGGVERRDRFAPVAPADARRVHGAGDHDDMRLDWRGPPDDFSAIAPENSYSPPRPVVWPASEARSSAYEPDEEVGYDDAPERAERRRLVYVAAAIVVVGLIGLGVTLGLWRGEPAPPEPAMAVVEPPAAPARPLEGAQQLQDLAGRAATMDTTAAPAPAGKSPTTPAGAESANKTTTGAPAADGVEETVAEPPAAAPAPRRATASKPAAPKAAQAKPKPAAAARVDERPAQTQAAKPVATRPVAAKPVANAPEPVASRPKPAPAASAPIEAAPQAPASSEPFGIVKRTLNSVTGAITDFGRSAIGARP